ncbi:unnamed protein product, partial [Discosporangium mesarthrocarpum]
MAALAHELLYAGTRPDGLRPLTGFPMVDGRSWMAAPGGIYKGFAGLQGLDLSFASNESTTKNRPMGELGAEPS